MAKQKIMLINPPIMIRDKSQEAVWEIWNEPLGLACLSAVLKMNNIDHEVFDTIGMSEGRKKLSNGNTWVGLPHEEILKQISESRSDIIGISAMFSSKARIIEDLIVKIRNQFPSKKIILGGVHATLAREYILEKTNADVCVLGEGEQTLVELYQCLTSKDSLNKVAGIVYRDDDGGYIQTNPRQPLDIKTLPIPNREILPINRYYQKKKEMTKINYYQYPIADIITSRGCIYNCIYCSAVQVWGRWRGRPAKAIVDEIEHLVTTYGIKEIRILDDAFNVNKQRVIDFCHELIKRKLDITWDAASGFIISQMDENMVPLLAESGLYHFQFPIESGHPNTLKYISKNVDLDKVVRLKKACDDHGIWTRGNFIIGFPHETKADITKSLNYAFNQADLDLTNVFIAQPYPGTHLRKIFFKEGLLKEEGDRGSNLFQSIYDTKTLTLEELYQTRARFIKRTMLKYLLTFLNPILFYKKYGKKIRNRFGLMFFLRRVTHTLEYLYKKQI